MIKIISVGKIKEQALRQLINNYLKMITRFHKVVELEVKDSDNHLHSDIVKESEAERLLKQINDQDYVILLDLKGKYMDSLGFASTLKQLIDQSKTIVFVIGGSLGVADKVLKRSNLLLKISDLTFTHNMAKLIVVEQIYRAFKINHNQTYHK